MAQKTGFWSCFLITSITCGLIATLFAHISFHFLIFEFIDVIKCYDTSCRIVNSQIDDLSTNFIDFTLPEVGKYDINDLTMRPISSV